MAKSKTLIIKILQFVGGFLFILIAFPLIFFTPLGENLGNLYDITSKNKRKSTTQSEDIMFIVKIGLVFIIVFVLAIMVAYYTK